MTKSLILCDGAGSSIKQTSFDRVEPVNTHGRSRNLNLRIDSIRDKYEVSERLYDLIHIASYVYAADTRISRGGVKDVLATNWSRDITLAVPVADIDFWNRGIVRELLKEALSFATDDIFEFQFEPVVVKRPSQLQFGFESGISIKNIDTVILFSGGIDSTAATIQALQEGKSPLLVSHLPTSKVAQRHKLLIKSLRDYYNTGELPHMSINLSNHGTGKATEYSQRSRAFVFLTLATLASALTKTNEILLCDNGIVSINLPQNAQSVGSLVSRSTHPRFLELSEELIRLVTDNPLTTVTNTLFYKTKQEVIEIISNANHPDLLQETVSCGHTHQSSNDAPHCGVCSQCVDRRFAVSGVGMQEHDLVSFYRKDIFNDQLEDGNQKTYVFGYVKFAQQLEGLANSTAFFQEFPQLADCIRRDDPNVPETYEKIYALYQRHQQGVNRVVESFLRDKASEIRRGKVESDTLLDMIQRKQIQSDASEQYARRLGNLIAEALPGAFVSVPAKNETHVQEVSQAVFKGALERLDRETPQRPYATVSTKPDFSKSIKDAKCLYFEFKYIRDRSRLNGVITEITSRTVIYSAQNSDVMFIVYDPARTIFPDDRFIADIERQPGCYVQIVR